MKNIFKIISTLFLITLSIEIHAQDVHFSHAEFSPMLLNPGLAGANSPLQVVVNYRSQWKSVASPYSTIGASVDARFNEKKRMKKGIFAGGLMFFNDQVGDLKVSTNNVNLNLAYHLILDRKSTLGLGLFGGFGQRSISDGDARWGSQYDGTAYDESIGSGEVFGSPSFAFMDVGAGLVYTYKRNEGYMTQNNQRAINAGVSFYHLNNPKYSFINNEDEKLPMRWSIFVNSTIGFQNSNTALLPGIYFNRQGKNMEILYGTYYRFTLSQGSKVTGFNKSFFFSLGLFHRWGDALVAKTMLEWGPVSTGFAYDFNISSLSEVSNARGGFELFLRYNLTGSSSGPNSKFN